MYKSLPTLIAAAGLVLALAAGATAAAQTLPRAVDILFETKHITAAAPGTELVYKFERKPSNEAMLGPGYTDDIKIKVESDAAAGKKNVVVTMFSGERAREPNRITDMDGNPILVVYLDNSLGHFQQLTGGDRSYLKNKFSASFDKDAKVEPVKVTYKGAQVDGYRISVTPFAQDPSRAKMRGYETATFSIVITDKIPGHFAKMSAIFSNTQKDTATLEEFTTLDGVGDIK